MRRFLIKVISIVLVSLLLMWGLDWVITNNLHHSQADMLVGMNDVYFDSTYYDVVIMGSSRGWVQYDPRIMDDILEKNCYNLSVNGRGAISQIIKYQIYEKRHGCPRLIIQNIDCLLLSEDNRFEREQYLPYFFDKELFDMIKKREGFSVLDRLIPLIRYAGYEQMIKEGLGLPNKMIKSGVIKGYRPTYSAWDGRKLEATKEVGFGLDPLPVSVFKQFLGDCREKGIKVVFVYAPFYIGARHKMSAKNERAMFDFFEQLAKEYDLPILSWWDAPISEETDFFYNATHLNAKGAGIFTTELSYCLDTLGIVY